MGACSERVKTRMNGASRAGCNRRRLATPGFYGPMALLNSVFRERRSSEGSPSSTPIPFASITITDLLQCSTLRRFPRMSCLRKLYHRLMRSRTTRLLLVLAAIWFFVDGLIHPYTWPGEFFQPTRTERLIRILFTHSREGSDTWGMLLCLFIAFWLWQRERDNENLR